MVSSIVDRLYVYDNSIDGYEAKLLFRLVDGNVAKVYTEQIPDWAKIIIA